MREQEKIMVAEQRAYDNGRAEGERRILKRLVEELLKINLDNKPIDFLQ